MVRVGDKFYPPKGAIVVLPAGFLMKVTSLAECKMVVDEVLWNIGVVRCYSQESQSEGIYQFFIDEIRDNTTREPERLPAPGQGPPVPLQKKLAGGDYYWSIGSEVSHLKPVMLIWRDGYLDNVCFNAGLCWETEAEAQMFCDWLRETMRERG